MKSKRGITLIALIITIIILLILARCFTKCNSPEIMVLLQMQWMRRLCQSLQTIMKNLE